MKKSVGAAAEAPWDEQVDVVVVGAGAAGTVAAIEAANGGARVLTIDRWGRGGASARSGGIIYAGGGTDQQLAAGFTDDPVGMERYLTLEEGASDDDEVLQRFCAESRENLSWLERLGVAIPMGFDAAKSVTPTRDEVGLYFSGNEKHFAADTPAVARGHRVAGAGMTGGDLMSELHAAARARGVELLDRARLTDLVVDDSGRVIGIEALVLDSRRATRLGHQLWYRLVDVAAAGLHRVPRVLTRAVDRWERNHSRRVRVRARSGVVLATGGFSFNHRMLLSYASSYARTMPLGTPGDDGSGIVLAQGLGADVRLMDRCGASRFIAPPISFCSGVLVDAAGKRICDESLYAATLSVHIAAHGGRAWLVVDRATRERVREQITRADRLLGRPLAEILSGRANHVLFPRLFGSINLYLNRKIAPSLDELARQCGLPVDQFRRTIDGYNATANTGGPDEMGKPAEFLEPIFEPPFAAVACHLDSFIFPAPCITLGGLDVDGLTQQVRRHDGEGIPGLHAVGRCAAGVASRSYVSGLSLADCVFSGRNAGRAVSADATTSKTSTGRGASR